MPHPVHDILKRIFDIELFAFDSRARDTWPSERFVEAFVGAHPDGYAEPRVSDGVHREREPQY